MNQFKCYHCAEQINVEATRCRFCGETVTPANRLGLPNWYLQTGSIGFGLTWIEMDLEERAFGGDTGNLAMLNGHNMVGVARAVTGDGDEIQGFRRFIDFVGNRLQEMHGNTVHEIERSFLSALLRYYYIVQGLLQNPHHWADDNNLMLIKAKLLEWSSDSNLDSLPPELKSEFMQRFHKSAEEIEKARRG